MMQSIVRRLPLVAAWMAALAVLPLGAQVVVPESMHSNETVSNVRNQAQIHTELAALYFQAGSMPVALEETNIAIAADPRYASAYNVRALVHTILREFDGADADFKKALSLAPNDPDINNNYGWFLCQRGRERESFPHFMIAIKNPLYATPERAYINAGSCAIKVGNLEDARAHLLQALRMAGDRETVSLAQIQLISLAYKEGKMTEARNRLQEIMQAGVTLPPDALWLGIRVEHKLGHLSEEKSLAAQLKRLYPTSEEYQAYLSGNYE
ncbi:MAG: type IV pilus biogenesis/stability protein PilW [Zoogloeaceae bacterium]|jgi:type IV pilus assembly protein PilF|nr:type IV pilus biogenesis/stability protein PilW [Zoogloeaceae bacterium]